MRISDLSSDVCSSDLVRHHSPCRRQELGRLDDADGSWLRHDSIYSNEGLRASVLRCLGRESWTVRRVQKARRRGHRSEERSVGKECVSTYRSRWSTYN